MKEREGGREETKKESIRGNNKNKLRGMKYTDAEMQMWRNNCVRETAREEEKRGENE